VPLIDLGTGTYRGFEGGLYPAGRNDPPPGHLAAGLAALARVVPRDSTGAVDTAAGRIVLLSIGMSNATQEFSASKQLADLDTNRSPRVRIVDGAQGGQTASIIASATAMFWRVVDQRLTIAGVTRDQVQVVWLKEANANPSDPFPSHADSLSRQLQRIVRILRRRFPNLAFTWLSSRTYGGYATTRLNPEPFAYESGFSVKWLIERQVAGDSALRFTGPSPVAPWLGWGPYLWADSSNPRSDGLSWNREDFVSDGTHPSTSGRAKVAALLLRFFTSDTLARPWFVRKSWESLPPAAPGAVILETPADSARFSPGPITFTWRPASSPVDRYLLEILHVQSGTVFADSAVTTESYLWTPPSPGAYRWRVRAHNLVGWGPAVAPRTFTVQPSTSVQVDSRPDRGLDLW
jgi:hypothetical protein